MAINKENNQNSMRRKKILWIQPASRDKALHKMADQEVLKQLAKRKISIYVITTTPKKDMHFSQENSQLHVISIPLKKIPLILPLMRTLLLTFLLPIYILTFKIDYIVERPDVSIISFIPTLILSRLRNVKFILDVRSVPVETFGFRGFMLKFWFSASIMIAKKFFDGITIITSSMKEEICDRFNINSKKVGVWTSGVSTRLFDPLRFTSERLEFRRKFGLSEKFVVFYHGIFTATRGLTQTVNAIKILKNKYPSVTLFLLGKGPVTSKIRTLIQDEGLQNNVVIHHAVNQSEVPKFISLCDICISPLPDHHYWRHQSPLKLLEYLAMEKVVIVTDITAHRSVIGENECGIYVSSTEPMNIAKKIEYAYNNRANLEKWGKFGRKIVEEKYTWEKVASDLENYMLSLNERVNGV